MKQYNLIKRISSNLKKISHATFVLLMMGIAVEATAQQLTVTGTVSDKEGPLIGVSVLVKNTRPTVGTFTDINGRYSITVSGQDAVLVFSYLGLVTQEIPVGEQRTVNVTLIEDSKSLEEVVVVGYYSQNIRDVSTAVSKINVRNMEGISTTSLATLLAGQAPGMTSVIRGGIPGAAGSGIVIRGNTSLSSNDGVSGLSNPLYIVDGVPMSLTDLAGFDVSQNDFLSSLNPDEIASISILKDAAATAIYGARGANGVIVLTTKKGTTGKARITARANFGIIETPPRLEVYIGEAEREAKLGYIRRSLSTLFGDQISEKDWVDIRNGIEVLGYALPAILTDRNNPYFNNAYDYQDLFYRSGFSQDYNVSMEGGSEGNSYRVGVGFRDDEGVLNGYGNSRITFIASLNNAINSKIQNDLVTRYTALSRRGGLNSYMRGMPTNPQNMLTSLLYRSQEELDMISGQLDATYNKNESHDISVSEKLTINFSENLAWENRIGVSTRFGSNDYFIPSTARENNLSYARSASASGIVTNALSLLKYNRTVKEDHQLFAFAALELNTNVNKSSNLEIENGTSDYMKVIRGYKKEDITDFDSFIEKSNMLSYFGQVAYGYKDNRYYLSATLRRDGSSQFGANNKWATFPSIMGYWTFSKEPWLEGASSWLSFGKIRASFGTTGEIPGDPILQYNSLIGINNAGAGLNNIGGGKMEVKTYGGNNLVVSDFGKVPNKNLSWAKKKEINFGLDLEMFKNRLFINADIYSAYDSGLIYNSFLAPYTGYNSLLSNLVDIVSRGFELGINAYLFPRNNDFQWDWTLNLAKNNSMVAKLGNGGRDYLSGNYAFVLGRPAFQYYMHEYIGVVQSIDDLPVNPMTGQPLSCDGDLGLAHNMQGKHIPGMPLFTDVNGDYRITNDNNDRKIIDNKSPEPKISGGLHTTIRYKSFSLRAQSSFAFGHWIFNTALQSQLAKFDSGLDFYTSALYKFDDTKYWQKPGDTAYYPMLYVEYSDGGGYRGFSRRSSMFLEKGDYWNIENITLSYTLSQKALTSIGLKGLNIYTTAQNVAMWKKSGVYDPRQVSKTGYYNGEAYPMSRSYILGLQIQF